MSKQINTQSISLLFVDDEPDMLEYLSGYFLKRAFAVDVAHDGEEGQRMAVANGYDLIILDNAMPKKTGAQVCAYLRTVGISTPIIILSAQSDTWSKTELLNIGADDYVTKPFNIAELAARIHALLRRSGRLSKHLPLTVGDVIVDRNSHVVTQAGIEIHLTVKEFKILELLIERKGLIVSREALSKHIWGIHANAAWHALDTHIANLRKKLNPDKTLDIVITIPGSGYRV